MESWWTCQQGQGHAETPPISPFPSSFPRYHQIHALSKLRSQYVAMPEHAASEIEEEEITTARTSRIHRQTLTHGFHRPQLFGLRPTTLVVGGPLSLAAPNSVGRFENAGCVPLLTSGRWAVAFSLLSLFCSKSVRRFTAGVQEQLAFLFFVLGLLLPLGFGPARENGFACQFSPLLL